ncbi:hypothetical protein G9A89_009167 [Geosiphon pyriformis]|nr:hypothetical protein G9A89_009167 [Geosiphon pyriformis]
MLVTLAHNISRSFLPKSQSEGLGSRVRRCLGQSHGRLDPFLICDIFESSVPGGFPDHPHRGFETVTYLLEGAVAHEDFIGNKGVIGPGDVQWMTAGKGIVHAEMPASTQPARGIQLWLNLKRSEKMIEPTYQDLKDSDISRAKPEEGITVKVIAGESFGIKSTVFTRTPTMMMDFTLAKGKKIEQPMPKGWNGFLYVFQGSALFGGKKFKGEANYTLFLDENPDADFLPVEAPDEDVRFILFGGEPIKEPIKQYGPFVMTTEQEISQTLTDFQQYQNGFERAKNFRSSIADGAKILF